MKSNIRELTCFGNVSGRFILPHEYKSLEIANIFNMQILPMGVKLRPLQAFKILSNFSILSSNLTCLFVLGCTRSVLPAHELVFQAIKF